MIEEHYYWKTNPLILHDEIHIHECIDETYLIHLKSLCFPCCLFCSDFCGGSPFTYWMKEHMDDYIDEHYISFGAHYYSHLQKPSLLPSDDAHLHGSTYDMHLSHLKTHGFSCSTLGSFDVGGTSSTTGLNSFMIGEHFCCQRHTLFYL